jgi:hypothetical protein
MKAGKLVIMERAWDQVWDSSRFALVAHIIYNTTLNCAICRDPLAYCENT